MKLELSTANVYIGFQDIHCLQLVCPCIFKALKCWSQGLFFLFFFLSIHPKQDDDAAETREVYWRWKRRNHKPNPKQITGDEPVHWFKRLGRHLVHTPGLLSRSGSFSLVFWLGFGCRFLLNSITTLYFQHLHLNSEIDTIIEFPVPSLSLPVAPPPCVLVALSPFLGWIN